MVQDKNFPEPKTQKTYLTLKLDKKIAKTNADKAELFSESVEKHFGIESNNFDSTNLREINQFVDANLYIFTLSEPNHHKDNDHSLVADVDPQELISIIKFNIRKVKLQEITSSHVNYLG